MQIDYTLHQGPKIHLVLIPACHIQRFFHGPWNSVWTLIPKVASKTLRPAHPVVANGV